MKVLLVFLILGGCSLSPKISEIGGLDTPLIDYSDTNNYQIVSLETCKSSTFSSLDKLIVNDSVITILDQEERKIVIFNFDGSFRSCVDKKGRASNEFIAMGDYAIYDNYIFLFDQHKRMMLKFNYDGEFIESTKFDSYNGMRFAKNKNNDYIFYQDDDNMETDNGEIIIRNLDGSVKKAFLNREIDDCYPITPLKYFSENENNIYFIPIKDDNIYRIDTNNELTCIYNFGLKKYMYEGYPYLMDLFMCNNNIFVCSYVDKNEQFDIFCNINNGKKRLHFEFIFLSSYKNCLITTIRCNHPFKIPTNLKYPITEDSNPALVFIKSEAIIF